MKLRRILAGLVSVACVALAAGAMTASPARADTAPTDSTLSVSTNDVFFGLEDIVQIRVDVAGGDGSPAGNFGLFIGQTILCSGAVTNGSGTCSLTPRQLAPGTYPLTAIYFGDENSGESASNTENLDVLLAPTTTTLALSAGTVSVSQEDAEVLTVQVTSPAGTPAGEYRILADGTIVCLGQLTNGSASCNLTSGQLPLGTHQLTATYAAQQGFDSSVSAPQALTVTTASTTTALTLSAPTVTLGGEDTEQLTATVRSGATGTLAGSVAITADNGTGNPALICRATVGADGTIACALTASQLPPGDYQLTATYSGDSTHDGSASPPQALTVTKPIATTTILTQSAPLLIFGREQAEHLTVQATSSGSGTPTGTVTVTAGSATVCTTTLASGTGSCTLTASQLPSGTYQLTASYSGDTTFAASASASAMLRIVRIAPS